MAATVKTEGEKLITALYCRLSVEDEKGDESNSIKNQKQILRDFAESGGYRNIMYFCDDGKTGTSFAREGFSHMQRMAEEGKIGTIIVKDLSRFGREQVEAGRLTQLVYPALGVTFISVQEHINSATGDGMEMLPFYNIFNEWYARQTSEKIRAVWRSRAEHGMRVSHSVPYGYVRDENDKECWHIDEPAAEIVRKIFALCIARRGPAQIARQLEQECVLTPTAYYASIGRKHTQKVPENPYFWNNMTVSKILENRQYTGCAVNFKSTTVSYKVRKKIFHPKEEYQILENMQEPIIPEEEWLRVQELREHRRQPVCSGKQSLFSGLVFCHDCGAKLYYCSAKSLQPGQEFYCCANYRNGRGECSIHYIRHEELEQRVLYAITELRDFVCRHETVFLYMLAKKDETFRATELSALDNFIKLGERRIKELDTLIQRIYEDNVNGRLSDERFNRMMEDYEDEQTGLSRKTEEAKKTAEKTREHVTDTRLLLSVLKKLTGEIELTPTIVNSLIQKIDVYSRDASSRKIKVDIYFTAIGMIDIPAEKDIQAIAKEMSSVHPNGKIVA